MSPAVADAEGGRRIERGGRHQHRRQADQRVEGGDQLRHRGHRRCAARSPRRCRRRCAMPATISAQAPTLGGGCQASVVTMAIAMPIMPKRLPWRAVSGLDRPRSARMNRTPGDEIEQRGEIGRHRRASLPLLLVHAEHALGDQEAAEDVHRGEHQRDEAEASRATRPSPIAHEPRRRPRAARRPRSPRRWRWSPTSAACAAPASPSTPRNSRRRSPARRSRTGRRTDRSRRRSPPAWRRRADSVPRSASSLCEHSSSAADRRVMRAARLERLGEVGQRRRAASRLSSGRCRRISTPRSSARSSDGPRRRRG